MTRAAKAQQNSPAGFAQDPADLSNLQHISPAAVQNFVARLNACTPNGKKLIAAIGTGGTLSMKIESGIRVPELDLAAIFDHIETSVKTRFEIVGLDAFRLDSSQLDYSYVADLAVALLYVWKHVKAPIEGFLITHGTDTMAYSAAAMSLMMGPGLPFSIVYTGAQKPIQEPMSDAGVNLRNAMFTLEALNAAAMAEVMIVMGDKAMLGASAVKIDNMKANAFAAPLHQYALNFAALEYPLRLASWLNPRRQAAFAPTVWSDPFSRTLIVNSHLGLDPAMVTRQAEDPHIQAVLLYSFGAGTVYDAVADAIMDAARARGLPVFVVSPVNSEHKAVYESGKKLIDKGVIPLFMTLPAALAKIEIALRLYPGGVDAISNFMKENYVGEIPSADSRFSPARER